MKTILLWSVALVAVLGMMTMGMGCGKATNTGTTTCTDVAVANDSVILLNFASANGLHPVKDTSGLYYQIVTQGTGPTPNDNSTIFVTYRGILMNGTIFDSTSNPAKTGFLLGTLISGWRIGLPKIQAGGEIKLLIPSHYGYGCIGNSPYVPSDAPLYFDVNLVTVQ
jgi:FKBP-type peptidyl-prolyl cis-trans isomerase FkpA